MRAERHGSAPGQPEAGRASLGSPHPSPAIAYNPEDAGRMIGLSRATMFRLIRRGAIPVKREGKSVLILHRDLEAYVEGLPYDDRSGA